MKKVTTVIAALLLAALPMKAQQVLEDSFQQLKVHYSTPDLQVSTTVIDGVTYSRLSIDGYVPGGQIGSPALPQQGSMIAIPICKGMDIVVENAVYDTVSLPAGSIVMPMQPSRSKSDNNSRAIVVDNSVYTTSAYHGSLAMLEAIGIARDRNLATLTFSPVRVNPVANTAVVCRSADITVRYIGADEQATVDLFQRYYTPAFSVGKTLNQLLSPKYVSTVTPTRMAVLAKSTLRCKKLDQFFDWKRSQGLRVDVFYIDELGLSAPSAIDAMLQGLYDNATAADPAPAFLLVVGDVAQVPSHNSKLSSGGWYGPDNSHITDLYFTTWTAGDKVSDCYFGRFSCTDTNTLGDIVDKTLLYEQYAFADDSYLARAALIAGVDRGYQDDNGYNYADPAMDYIARYYVNHDNGYDTIVYFKNATSIHPANVVVNGSSNSSNAAIQLRNFYSTGAGWINYSAHGDWNCWAEPEFTVNHANSMSNIGMPSFMIGSCCLSNKFNSPCCLGEALLRRGNNAGAIGYIGGTNSTYWTEDFYWAVGVRNNISGSMNATYDASHLGVYDRIFHTNGETFANSISTAGQIILYGNMTVQNSSSELKDYYWEIYQLMGDPSLMPWLGRAAEPYAEASNSAAGLVVHTMPNAYVAVVNPDDNNAVLAAAFSDADGNVTLEGNFSNNHKLAVTAQNYKPFSMVLSNLAIGPMQAPRFSVYPNPASGRCVVACEGMRSLQLINTLGQTVRNIQVQGSSAEVSLNGLTPGVYLLRVATAAGSATEKIIVR